MKVQCLYIIDNNDNISLIASLNCVKFVLIVII